MISLLLIAALAVQTPPASKPTADTSAQRRPTTRTAAVSRMAFHDAMRELWTDHIIYTHHLIVSTSGGLADTGEVRQRLLRNQDEIGDAIKPYYGDSAGQTLASLLRGHIQHAAVAMAAAKGQTTAMQGNITMRDTSGGQFMSQRDTVQRDPSRQDTTQIKNNPAYPSSVGRVGDTTKARAEGQDTASFANAVAALRANADSIATFLASANSRNWSRSALQSALQMRVNLLLQGANAHFKRDWSGSIASFDASKRQAQQMADMLSEGIMKQFPNRFTNQSTSVSTRQ